jgi:hypothetical protein
MGVGGQPHDPAAFTLGKDSVPIVQEDCSPLSTCVLCRRLQRAKIPDAVLNIIFPPEDGHVNARNM